MRGWGSVACALLALWSTSALAKDPEAPLAFSRTNESYFSVGLYAAGVTDFIYRGRTLSDHGPAIGGHVEPRFGWLYAGLAAATVELATRPDALLNAYAGVRPTFGPFSLDLRASRRMFPGSVLPGTNIATDIDYWELAARPTFIVGDFMLLRGQVAHVSDFVQSGASETFLSGTIGVRGPRNWLPEGWDSYASAEIGRERFGITSKGIDLPDYTTWNVGVGLAFKGFVFDLRYYKSGISKEDCAVLTQDPGSVPGGVRSLANPLGFQSDWCGSVLAGKLSFSTSLFSRESAEHRLAGAGATFD